MKSPRKFKLEFATDNAAFEQYPYDLNGNRIGQWSLK
jgi:hypothetical protein